MTRAAYTRAVIHAWWQLLRFDLIHAFLGFQGVQRALASQPARAARHARVREDDICDAVLLAACFYWKPVLCLQRSFSATTLLRRHGVAARLVIGYRPIPFLAHAWVEAGGRVVNDSPVYPQRLRVLHTF